MKISTTEQHIDFQGLPIVVEWPEGSIREGKGKDGKPWEREMLADYGYVDDTVGAGDKEPLDVYVGHDKQAPYAYVVEQLKDDGSFDEFKCMLGFPSLEEARECYLAHYPADWAETNLGEIYEVSIEDLNEAVEEHTQ